MLRLTPFELRHPASLTEAIECLVQTPAARVLAGGTDMLPNLKHRIYGDLPVLVSLRKLAELRGISHDNHGITIGACEKLSAIARQPLISDAYPALALAAATVASPQIRNMATLGGNLCLDTRCTFINQTAFWRHALGGCLKAEGTKCHVVPGGQNCVAAFSGDMAIALIALEASAEIAGPDGTRSLPIAELYSADGRHHLNLQPGEILTRVHVPIRRGRRLAFRKWSVRQSIDFPLVNVAIRVDETPQGKIADLVAVVGVLASRPKVLTKIADLCRGKKLAEELAGEIGEAVYRACKPVPNVPYDHEYRREMIRVQARRAAMCLLPGHAMQVREG